MRLGFWLGLQPYFSASSFIGASSLCLRLFFLGVELFEQFQLFGQQLRLFRVVQIAAHGVVFVEDHVAALAGLQVDDPGEEADLVVGVQVLPQAVDILPGDTPEVLQKRVMEQAEWKLLPKAVAMVCSGEIK